MQRIGLGRREDRHAPLAFRETRHLTPLVPPRIDHRSGPYTVHGTRRLFELSHRITSHPRDAARDGIDRDQRSARGGTQQPSLDQCHRPREAALCHCIGQVRRQHTEADRPTQMTGLTVDCQQVQLVVAPRDAKPQIIHGQRRAKKSQASVNVGRACRFAADLPTQLARRDLECHEPIPMRFTQRCRIGRRAIRDTGAVQQGRAIRRCELPIRFHHGDHDPTVRGQRPKNRIGLGASLPRHRDRILHGGVIERRPSFDQCRVFGVRLRPQCRPRFQVQRDELLQRPRDDDRSHDQRSDRPRRHHALTARDVLRVGHPIRHVGGERRES